MIGRRGFLGILTGAVAAPLVVRPGLLMPVRVPPLQFNQLPPYVPLLLTPEDVTRRALAILHQKMQFARRINAEYRWDWPANYSEGFEPA